MKKAHTALQFEQHKQGVLLDARSPGLRLVATGDKRSWIYRYRLHSGQLRQIRLGDTRGVTLAEARDLWAAQKKIRDGLLDPRDEKKRVIQAEQERIQAAYTVDEMVADWIRLHATNLERGDEMERLLRREVLAKWKGRPAATINRRDCVDLFEVVNERAPRVAEQMMSAVRGAFRLAIDRARLDMTNPALGVGSMKRAERKRAFTEAELRLFLPWLATARLSPNVRDVMRLTLLTACRSGEACETEWPEIGLEQAIWTQPAEKTKNGRSHRVMLPRQAVSLLTTRKEVHPRYVFPSRGNKPILQKAVGFAQYEAHDFCPVKDWTVHDLRRTALTRLASMGCPRVVQDRIANHTDRSIAAIYDVHSYDDEAGAWLQKWADYLDALEPRTPAAHIEMAAPDNQDVLEQSMAA